MRRILLWFASTVSAVVLLFGYHTSTSSTLAASSSQTPFTSSSTGTTAAGSDQTASGAGGASGSTSGSTGGSTGGATGASGTTTVTGAVAQTQWGPVQVQLSLDSGSITKVSVLQYPSGNPRDAQINGYALPILIDRTMQAQSAQIQMVSGATVTSGGYLSSLQSALDRVNG